MEGDGSGTRKYCSGFGPGGGLAVGRLHGGTLGKSVFTWGKLLWRLILSPLGSCFCFTFGGSNTRKTHVWELPGARKNVENAPQNLRKIRGFGWETSVFARFGYVLGVKNVAKPSENAVFPAGTS